MIRENLVDLTNISSIIEQLISSWQKAARIQAIKPLTPDASARRYFRIYFSEPVQISSAVRINSAVAMVFLSTAPAETGGGEKIPSDRTYVELTELFSLAGVPVPLLLVDRRDISVLLIEDCGDTLLGDLLTGSRTPGTSPDEAYHRKILNSYQSAVSELVRLRRVVPPSGHFLQSRRFSVELFYKEVCEFRDFYLASEFERRAKELSAAERATVEYVLTDVAAAAAKLPIATVHRDYHSWNLLVQGDESPRIRVIDFQDALQGPLHYDLAGLVNDRDTDSLLGPELRKAVIDCYKLEASVDTSFDEHFALVSIQRDLKVAGRFGKLTRNGFGNYQRWVPGTVNRLKRNLEIDFSPAGLVGKALSAKLRDLAEIIGELA